MKQFRREAKTAVSDFLHEVNHKLMGDFVSMSNEEIWRFQKMEKLLESKISRRFKVRRLNKDDFGYLIEHLYGQTGTAYEDYEYYLPKKRFQEETLVKYYDLIKPTRCLIEENQRYLKIEQEDGTVYAAYFTINSIVGELDFPSSEIFYYQQQQFTFPIDTSMNVEIVTNRKALSTVRNKKKELKDLDNHAWQNDSETSTNVVDALDSVNELESTLDQSKESMYKLSYVVRVTAPDLEELKRRCNEVKDFYDDLNVKLVRPFGDMLGLGLYVAYTGLIKRETTKAIHAVVNFVVVFVLSAAFIAYAPDYIGKINEFSADISNASLTLGTKIVLPNSESQGKDSVDLIRDSLFSIQVKQPWLLLQYGNSDVESIGADRVERLLSTSPDENNGQDREEIVVEEIEDRENTNLTITKTINRLGTVFFLFMFNMGISIFVFLLTGIMIFSQVLFIIYAMFLPVSFLLSMVPSFEGMSKRAITKLFNTILTRAGITLIITVAFSISTMLYNLSGEYPFFLTAFLQIVTFAGIYFKLGDLMGMFSLQSGDSQSMGSRIMRRPRMLMHAHMHRLQHKLGRSVAALGAGTAAYHAGKQAGSDQRTVST